MAVVCWTPDRGFVRVCLACGRPLDPSLESLGSLRCLDCREENAQLDPAFVADWSEAEAPI